MFFFYRQNNSYGVFDIVEEDGISIFVIIEAEDDLHADRRAQQIGIYFDESFVVDCDCCGARWSRAEGKDGTTVPCYYHIPVHDMPHSVINWAGDAPQGFIHYLDGRREAVWLEDGALRVKPWSEAEALAAA